jgi:PAS domain-containing protein
MFEQYLKATLASIGDAVVCTDAAGNIVFANAVALKLLHARGTDIRRK